jgi:hypothetical protein
MRGFESHLPCHVGMSSSGQDTRLSIARREFDPLHPYQSFGSLAKTGKRSALNRENGSSILPGPTRLLAGSTTVVRLAVNQQDGGSNPLLPAKFRAVRCMVYGLIYIPRNRQIGVLAGFESQHGHHAGVIVWRRCLSYTQDQWSSILHPGTSFRVFSLSGKAPSF